MSVELCRKRGRVVESSLSNLKAKRSFKKAKISAGGSAAFPIVICDKQDQKIKTKIEPPSDVKKVDDPAWSFSFLCCDASKVDKQVLPKGFKPVSIHLRLYLDRLLGTISSIPDDEVTASDVEFALSRMIRLVGMRHALPSTTFRRCFDLMLFKRFPLRTTLSIYSTLQKLCALAPDLYVPSQHDWMGVCQLVERASNSFAWDCAISEHQQAFLSRSLLLVRHIVSLASVRKELSHLKASTDLVTNVSRSIQMLEQCSSSSVASLSSSLRDEWFCTLMFLRETLQQRGTTEQKPRSPTSLNDTSVEL